MKGESKNKIIDIKYDFGLTEKLKDAISGAAQLIELNETLSIENRQLKQTISEIEYDIEVLRDLNKELFVLLDKAKTDTQKLMIITDYDEALSYSYDCGFKYLSKINWLDIEIDRWEELLKIAYEHKCLRQVLTILTYLITNKSGGKVDYVISKLIASTMYFLDNRVDFDINETVKYLDILYASVDEDLLVELTYENKDFFEELFTERFDNYIELKVKVARILYSVEEYRITDSVLTGINFRSYDEYPIEDEIRIEVLLILIHLTKYKSIDDYIELGIWIKNSNYSDIDSIYFYFNAINQPVTIDKTVKELEIVLESFESLNSEVRYGIIQNSFNYMIDELTKLKAKELNAKESLLPNTTNNTIPKFVSEGMDELNNKINKNSTSSSVKILCFNCLVREDCFETYLKKTECEYFKSSPTKQPRDWPKEMEFRKNNNR